MPALAGLTLCKQRWPTSLPWSAAGGWRNPPGQGGGGCSPDKRANIARSAAGPCSLWRCCQGQG